MILQELPLKEELTVDVLNDIKQKIEDDFNVILEYAAKGKYDMDYSNIMDMISFVEYYNYFPHPAATYQKLKSR